MKYYIKNLRKYLMIDKKIKTLEQELNTQLENLAN